VSFLIDANVVSEIRKPRVDPNVVRWFSLTPEEEIWLSVMTVAEIRLGMETMPASSRRDVLLAWLETDLPDRFAGRIIAIGAAVADAFGRLMARAQRFGHRLEVIDGLLAATAETHQLTLVTRNTKDFEELGISLLNPWLATHERGE
jgi:toxin FitB